MIIGNDFSKIAIQLEYMIPYYSSPSGMFNFIIDEKFIPGEGVAVDLYVTISFLKKSINDESIQDLPDIGNVKLDELDFSEELPHGIIELDTGAAEISGRGYWFYLGFDGEEERLIFTIDEGESYQERRYPRGTMKKLINSLPNADELEIVQQNEVIMLTDLKG